MLTLSSHTFQYFVVRAGNGIFALVTLVIFSRLLSPTEYGLYALGTSIATVASGVLFQWLNLAVGRFYVGETDDKRKVSEIATLGFWVSTAAAAILFIGVLPIREVLGVELVLFFIVFLITVFIGRHTLALQLANAESRPFQYGLLSWAKCIGTLVGGIILIGYGIGGTGALMGILTGLVFSQIVFDPQPLIPVKFTGFDKRLAKLMFCYGLPLTFNNLALALVDVADRFLILSLLGMAHVAPYSVAYDLVQQLVGPLMNVLFLAAFPLIVRMFETAGGESISLQLHALGSSLIRFGLPCAISVGYFASDISEIFFSDDYHKDAAASLW